MRDKEAHAEAWLNEANSEAVATLRLADRLGLGFAVYYLGFEITPKRSALACLQVECTSSLKFVVAGGERSWLRQTKTSTW